MRCECPATNCFIWASANCMPVSNYFSEIRMNSTNYTTSAELAELVRQYVDDANAGNELAAVLKRMITGILARRRAPEQDHDDCLQDCLLVCLAKSHRFDPKKSANAFGYFSAIIFNTLATRHRNRVICRQRLQDYRTEHAQYRDEDAINGIKELLRSAIMKSGQSQFQIGKEIGISRSHIGEFVLGKRDLRLSTVSKLCSHLHLTLVKEKLENNRKKSPTFPIRNV